jgi:hypothetical protein
MVDILKVGNPVRVKTTNKIALLTDIQNSHNRYQLHGVSNWQYGIDDLEYMDVSSLIATIDALQMTPKVDEPPVDFNSFMSDIQRIKKVLKEAEGVDAGNIHLAGIDAGNAWYKIRNHALSMLSSLVFTLESLQTKMAVDAAFAKVILAERKFAWWQIEQQDLLIRSLERKMKNTKESWDEKVEQIRSLEQALSNVNAYNAGHHYTWIPYAENHLETLSMPVLIEADWIRQLIAEGRGE